MILMSRGVELCMFSRVESHYVCTSSFAFKVMLHCEHVVVPPSEVLFHQALLSAKYLTVTALTTERNVIRMVGFRVVQSFQS
jgi:hypothetical protein